MPDLFGTTPPPAESATGSEAVEAERGAHGGGRREADRSRRARRHTGGSQSAQPERRGAGESRSSRRTASKGAAAAGSARGGYRFAGARLSGPAAGVAAVALVIAALTAIALPGTNDAPKRAPRPERAQPSAPSAAGHMRDSGRPARRVRVLGPAAGRARERSDLTRRRPDRNPLRRRKAPTPAPAAAPAPGRPPTHPGRPPRAPVGALRGRRGPAAGAAQGLGRPLSRPPAGRVCRHLPGRLGQAAGGRTQGAASARPRVRAALGHAQLLAGGMSAPATAPDGGARGVPAQRAQQPYRSGPGRGDRAARGRALPVRGGQGAR
jgi:hypothetical protein